MTLCVNYISSLCMVKGVCAGITSVYVYMHMNSIYVCT